MKNIKDIVKDLEKNLEADHVKQRKGPGGLTLDYLEGWHVIRELNRIFGHDGWHQTCKINHVSGEDRRWHVIATVAITVRFLDDGDVCELTREDVGYGNGDIELAHKEAVTDAFKRACRTLGYPLGLALYDKEKEHVGGPTLSKRDGREVFAAFEKAMRMATSKEMLEEWGHDNAEAIKTLPADWRSHIKDEYKRCMEALDK